MSLPDGTPAFHAFLYADPAAHSLSPRMHRAAFAHAGLNGTYDALRVAPADLPGAVEALRRPGVLGANLSLPHKEAALPLLDSLSSAARAVGAVNTIVHRDGQLHGDNTDSPGLRDALYDAGYIWEEGAEVIVLGAGGAARAAVHALNCGQQNVTVVNRTLERAQAIAADWHAPDAHFQVTALPAHAAPWESAALVVNASSAGLNDPDQTPLDATFLTRLPARTLVYDMVYKPAETRLMREARAAGLNAENGLGMLAHQARLAFRAWTGADVPVSVFLNALTDLTDPGPAPAGSA
ncbi:shikimate dehydrogenase (NADP(+)) [Deinococcus seoulensis]|uniref:Shikimate dehydrogenase (NADP(+)) n=2 Tax=Deinococcus seoulensis TaxID=1837379 RepID=A0ABQ2RPV3_9DEIO|nr:shikimate dehydrogenase [Deinococcus seoulensis]GGR44443.1 shikimate dehydrogenase (NADP(+)) [Deinococcus seoulensis]